MSDPTSADEIARDTRKLWLAILAFVLVWAVAVWFFGYAAVILIAVAMTFAMFGVIILIMRG